MAQAFQFVQFTFAPQAGSLTAGITCLGQQLTLFYLLCCCCCQVLGVQGRAQGGKPHVGECLTTGVLH